VCKLRVTLQFITHTKQVRTIPEIYHKAWRLSLPGCRRMLRRLKTLVSVATFRSLHFTRKESWTCLMYCISNIVINSCTAKMHYITSHTFKAINEDDKSVYSLPCYCGRRCSVLRLTRVQTYCMSSIRVPAQIHMNLQGQNIGNFESYETRSYICTETLNWEE
jgi:hypothetical protein